MPQTHSQLFHADLIQALHCVTSDKSAISPEVAIRGDFILVEGIIVLSFKISPIAKWVVASIENQSYHQKNFSSDRQVRSGARSLLQITSDPRIVLRSTNCLNLLGEN